MGNILMGLQVLISVAMIVVILPQQSKNATPTQFGEETSQAYFKPKGKEAFLNSVTRVLAVLFFLNAIALVMVMK